MLRSEYYIPTLREIGKDITDPTHQLMLKAGLVQQVASGVYSFSPLATKAIRKIENLIRKCMEEIGFNEMLMPCLQPKSLWEATGRDLTMAEVLLGIDGDKGWEKDFVLGPTCEELITNLMAGHIRSYKQLPMKVFHIQTKFRNELRPQNGVMRTREFLMKDGYSFHSSQEDLEKTYKQVHDAYMKLFNMLGLKCEVVVADSEDMGGNISEEFNINGVEVAHIFQLGDKYTKALNCSFADENNKREDVLMGCYGIGISRLLYAIIDSFKDENGIVWPNCISPCEFAIIDLSGNADKLDAVVAQLEMNGYSFMIDDRKESAGVKFVEADLLGFNRILISKKTLENNSYEVKTRYSGEINQIQFREEKETK